MKIMPISQLLRRPALAAAACALMCAATGCSHLSSRAKKIAGDYYIPEVSEEVPLMELRRDGTCTFRAIRPGVLTYEVQGRWNVERDTLTARLDTASVTFQGDSTLIGRVPPTVSRRVVRDTELGLELEDNGVSYVYRRRYHE